MLMNSETLENYIYCINGLKQANEKLKLKIDDNSLPHMAIEIAKLEELISINKAIQKLPTWDCQVEISNAITGELNDINNSITKFNKKTIYENPIRECPNCFAPVSDKYDVCPECGFTIKGSDTHD